MGGFEGQDEMGNPLRTTYERDEEFKGTRIPSGKGARSGGGSYGFDSESLDFEQNIISCDGNGHETIVKVTARQLSEQSIPEHDMPRDVAMQTAGVQRLQDQAAEQYKRAAAAKPMGESAAAIPEALNTPDAPALAPDVLDTPAQKPVIGPSTIREDWSDESDESDEPEKPEKPEKPDEPGQPDESEKAEISQRADTSPAEPILVTFSAAFGKITQPYSTLFRDGICLVLVTDHRQLSNLYTLPDIEDEPLDVEVQAGNRVLSCVWGGLQFTMPNVPVTFTILLVKEERNLDDGENRGR